MLSSVNLSSNPVIYFGFKKRDARRREETEAMPFSIRARNWLRDFFMKEYTYMHGEVVFLYEQWPTAYMHEIERTHDPDDSVIAFSVAVEKVYLKTRTFVLPGSDSELRLNDAYDWIGFRPTPQQYHEIALFATMQKGKPAATSFLRSMMMWGTAADFEDNWNCFALMVRVAQMMGFLEGRNAWLVTLDELHEHMSSEAYAGVRIDGLDSPAENLSLITEFFT